jgi:hypothetical protein
MTRRVLSRSLPVLALLFLTVPGAALAKSYPTHDCVAAKLRATALQCSAALKAWAKFDKKGDAAARDATLAAALADLEDAFAAAESAAAEDAVDCTETTLPGSAMGALVDAAVLGIANEVNTGLDLGDKKQARCGASILKAAAAKCKKLLRAEGKYVKTLGRTPRAGKRDAAQEKAGVRFAAAFTRATASGCPTAATEPSLEARVDQLNDDAVMNAIVSPSVPTTFATIVPGTEVEYLGETFRPICALGTPYEFYVRRGTVNKVLYYFQGGGACWDWFTCAVGACDQSVDGAEDNPALAPSGFFDLANPANPFRDWHIVFIPYCTCDVHWGDATYTHTNGPASITIEHRGFVNAAVVEKWAREHFVAPDEVFVTGSSAGAYGAIAGSLYLQERTYRGARFNVLGDAGNGVITQDFLVNYLANWGIEKRLPTWIKPLDRPLAELSIVDLWSYGAAAYPGAKFAQYTSSYDGGNGSQTQFYNIMLHPGDIGAGLMWWNASCAWNDIMRDFAQQTSARTPNYRYYIGAGSQHTIWFFNKVYTDTTGGVLPMVDWLAQMRSDDPAWADVECTDCNLLPGTCSGSRVPGSGFDDSTPGATCQDDVDCPGATCQGEDVRPSPLVAPYGPGGIITCP